MKNLLWIGDACVDSGFARATHYTLEGLDYRYRGEFNCSVLGVNYLGDPHSYRYPVYPCWPGQDMFGIGRLMDLIPQLKPDVIVIQNDPWNIPHYMAELKPLDVPVVASLAVDGLNCRGGNAKAVESKDLNGFDLARVRGLNDLALAIFWTEYGRQQAIKGGCEVPTVVVPLGVDTKIYKPQDKKESRKWLGLPMPEDAFLVGSVGRNQYRKRLDLMLFYFAEWVREHKRDDAYLFVHSAPTGEVAFDIKQLVGYLGLNSKVIVSIPGIRKGETEETLARLYSSFDVYASTTQGEGFGLPALEAMACGTPCLLPDWSAFGDWAKGAARLVPCTTLACTYNSINVVGGIADRKTFVSALDEIYQHPQVRDGLRESGLERAREPRFDWKNIGKAFADAITNALWPEKVVAPIKMVPEVVRG